MATRKIARIMGDGGVSVRVYFDVDWAEYRVIPCMDDVPNRDATYYTDDYEDAMATAREMAVRYVD